MQKLVLIGMLAFTGTLSTVHAHESAMHGAASKHPHNAAHSGAAANHPNSAAPGAANAAEAPISQTLQVSDCWVRGLPVPAPSAGYFVVANTGDKDVKLQRVVSDAYRDVMLHQTTHEGGLSRMSHVHEVVIPAGGQLEFKPGGYHVMLEDAPKAPVIGSRVEFNLLFDTGEKAPAMCEIKAANTRAH